MFLNNTEFSARGVTLSIMYSERQGASFLDLDSVLFLLGALRGEKLISMNS